MIESVADESALGVPDDVLAELDAADTREGLPSGTMLSIMTQEVGGQFGKFLGDPRASHFEKGADGKRRAPNGKVSSAFGLFGILESTAADPGFGVKPLAVKDQGDIKKQIQFAASYLKGRTGNDDLSVGLGKFGEGPKYAAQVLGRIGLEADPSRAVNREAPIPRPNVRNPIPQPNTTAVPPPPQRRPGEQDAVRGDGQVPQDNPFNAPNPFDILNRDHTRDSNDPFDILNRDHTLGLPGGGNPVPPPAPELQPFGVVGRPNNTQQIQDRLRQTQGTEIII